MRRMDLSRLRYFYTIAQEGVMNKAAEKLNISQPALSRIINQFEERIGTKLFERLPNGMRLTAQGERLYAHARKILEEQDAFEKNFYDKEDEIEGDLTIVTTPFLGSEWIIFKIEKLLKRYPKLRLKIIVREDRDIYEARNIYLEEGDVAIFSAPVYPQPNLIQKEILACYIQLVASPSYLKKHGILQTLEDLDGHQFITYGGTKYNPYGNKNWILTIGKNSSDEVRESYIEINSLQGMINAALKGYGIAEVPNFPGVLKEGLVVVNLNTKTPKIMVNFIFHEKRRNSKKINLLLKYLLSKEKE